jgi:hypothetical protein
LFSGLASQETFGNAVGTSVRGQKRTWWVKCDSNIRYQDPGALAEALFRLVADRVAVMTKAFRFLPQPNTAIAAMR